MSLSRKEHETVREVIEFYEFDDEHQKLAWERVEDEWKRGAGRFYAYNTAHRVCSAIAREIEQKKTAEAEPDGQKPSM